MAVPMGKVIRRFCQRLIVEQLGISVALVALVAIFATVGSAVIAQDSEKASEGPMLRVIVENAPIQVNENGANKIVGEVARDSTHWSLMNNGNYYLVVEPKSGKRAWIKSQHVSAITYGVEQLKELERASLLHTRASKKLVELSDRHFRKNDKIRFEVRPLFLESLAIRETILDANHPLIAESKLGLGRAYHFGNERQLAIKQCADGLAIRERRYGLVHQRTLESLDRLLEAYEYNSALLQRRYEMLKELNGAEHPKTLTALSRLAFLKGLGGYDDAKTTFQLAIETFTDVLGEQHEDTLSLKRDLGFYLLQYEEVEEGFSVLREVVSPPKDRDATTGSILRDLRDIVYDLLDEGENIRATQIRKQLVKFLRESVGNDNEDAAYAQYELADFYVGKKQYDEAIVCGKDAYRVLSKTLSESETRLQNCAELYCRLLMWSGEYESAEAIMQKFPSEVAPYFRTHLGLMPYIWAKTGRISEATKYHHEKSQGLFDRRSQSVYSIRDLESDYRRGLADLALSHAIHARNDTDAREKSAAWLFMSKNSVTENVTRNAHSVSPRLKPLAEQLKSARRNMSHYAQTLGPDYDQDRQKFDDAKARAKLLEDELWKPARKVSDSEMKWVTVRQVQNKLEATEVLIDFARISYTAFESDTASLDEGADIYAAWVTTQSGVSVFNLGPASDVDNLIKELRRQFDFESVRQIRESGEDAAAERFLNQSQRLFDSILRPIATTLDPHVNQFIISPDSQLWLVPWAALADENGRYLIESGAVRLVSSGRELVTKTEVSITTDNIEIIADPDFTNVMDVPWSKSGFQPLPGTAVEARGIADTLTKQSQGLKTRIHVGRNASEALFKELMRPKILVLSTHGFFRSEGRNLVNCGLVLAADSNSGAANEPSEDGILTALEILSSDLRGTELVVLSACDTGVGDTRNGEGVAGLRRAFQIAGAESVLASLWQVDDIETSRLIDLFFENLANDMNKSEALRQAQLTRIKARRARYGAAHPFFWAAFTLTGQE